MREWFIHIDDCCGCGACEQVCTKKAITMRTNEEGFIVPVLNESLCVDCGSCAKVCPVKNALPMAIEEPKTYIGRSSDFDKVRTCATGGLITQISEWVINQGGVVFGVRFTENWDAKFEYAETFSQLEAFKGSKYIAADVGDAYKKVLSFLNSGRQVLFVGLPCQVSGLNHFLHRSYNNLLTIDLMCHSVPSPMVWKTYLQSVSRSLPISFVSFRNKDFGWSRYGLKIESNGTTLLKEPNDTNLFMRGFIMGLYNRKSCANCPARGFNTGSDLMIGDYWEIDKYHSHLNDNLGMSLIFSFTEKGEKMLNALRKDIHIEEIPFRYVDTKGMHGTLLSSARPHPCRPSFFKSVNKHPKRVQILISKYLSKSLRMSWKSYVKCIIKKFVLHEK